MHKVFWPAGTSFKVSDICLWIYVWLHIVFLEVPFNVPQFWFMIFWNCRLLKLIYSNLLLNSCPWLMRHVYFEKYFTMNLFSIFYLYWKVGCWSTNLWTGTWVAQGVYKRYRRSNSWEQQILCVCALPQCRWGGINFFSDAY